jgi:hypothetical protein
MASFDDVGFLSDELGSWVKAARVKYVCAFEIADRMAHMTMRMLWDMPLRDLTESQLWAAAGYGRAITAFQSSILLAERGALADARAAARVCAECVIVVAGLLKVEGTLEQLKEDEAKHGLGICNQVLEINVGRDQSGLARFVARKAEVETEFGKPRSLKLGSLAAKADLALLYELAFRLTSGNAAHATIGSFRRHITQDPDGELRFHFGPDDSDMRSTLLAANASVIHLIGLAVDFMDLKKYDAESRDLVLHWQVIRPQLEVPDDFVLREQARVAG